MNYEIAETEMFVSWRENLKDLRAKDKIRSRINRASMGNFGDWKTESGEVKAMRIDYGPAYRLYYVIRGNKIVFLLCGGDKRTQQADIKQATELAKGVES
jgi:putative addiction module killer protein